MRCGLKELVETLERDVLVVFKKGWDYQLALIDRIKTLRVTQRISDAKYSQPCEPSQQHLNYALGGKAQACCTYIRYIL